MSDLRTRLRNSIKKSGYLIKELAALANVNKRTLDKWIGLNPKTPNVIDFVMVAKALGVTAEYLVTGSDSSDPWLREHRDFIEDCKALTPEQFLAVETTAKTLAKTNRAKEDS